MQVRDDPQAKVLAVREFPENTHFEVIEDLATQIGDALTCELIQHAVGEQAQRLEQKAHACPTCRGPTELRPVAPHLVGTDRGEVAWNQCLGDTWQL